jgi:hypothetical protein
MVKYVFENKHFFLVYSSEIVQNNDALNPSRETVATLFLLKDL